jgi:uncharacterized protein YqjF (DUF2071 family)
MRLYEVAKQGAEIRRGLVLMALEGTEQAVQGVAQGLGASGFPSTQCSEHGDKAGDMVEFFSVRRSDLAEFKAIYRAIKQGVAV